MEGGKFNCKMKLFWLRLRAVPAYGHQHNYDTYRDTEAGNKMGGRLESEGDNNQYVLRLCA